MSEVSVNMAKRAYAAFNRGGVDAILEFLDPDIEWRMWEEFDRGGRIYRGHAGAREVLGVFEENFDDFSAEPMEIIDKDSHLVVPFRIQGRAKGTGEEATYDLVHVWTMTGELRAGRVDVYGSIDDALEAIAAG